MSKSPRLKLKNWVHFLAYSFGAGLLPMPKTAACLLGVLFFLFFCKLPLGVYALVLLAFFVAGVWLCEVTARELKASAHRSIVIDQTVGMMIALFAVPLTWKWILLAFLLFRLLGMCPLWPSGWVKQHVMGGLGMMLDDLTPAAYTLIILQLGAWLMGLAPL